MSFVKKEVNTTPIEDTVFAIVKKAKEAKAVHGAEHVVDATIGSLYDEEGKLVAFTSVFQPYDQIAKEQKAKYADSFTGNASFRQQVYDWVCQDANLTLAHSVIATPGGSGAVAITFEDILDMHQTVVLPDIAWGSYALMASMHNLKTRQYTLFDGDRFHMESFKQACRETIEKQDKLLVVINDPCHNPTGYSLTIEEWKEIIAFLNECGKKVPVVLLNDIAYIDYSYDLGNSRRYLECFNDISDSVMAVIAFSCSKTLTSYGLRCGAAVLLAKQAEAVRSVEIVFEKTARATWSNIPNAAMDNFTAVTTVHREEYEEEKQQHVDHLKQRSDIFVREANACDLPIYPYKEGFFVTVRVEDNALRDRYHEALMDHLIFTVKVNKGIRVAVCSLPIASCYGLAKRMKDILEGSK